MPMAIVKLKSANSFNSSTYGCTRFRCGNHEQGSCLTAALLPRNPGPGRLQTLIGTAMRSPTGASNHEDSLLSRYRLMYIDLE
jgi:hypothetical protein